MWNRLGNVNQLVVGQRIRTIILEGDITEHEMVFLTNRIGINVFMLELIEQNVNTIGFPSTRNSLREEQRIIIPYSIELIPSSRFDFWTS